AAWALGGWRRGGVKWAVAREVTPQAGGPTSPNTASAAPTMSAGARRTGRSRLSALTPRTTQPPFGAGTQTTRCTSRPRPTVASRTWSTTAGRRAATAGGNRRKRPRDQGSARPAPQHSSAPETRSTASADRLLEPVRGKIRERRQGARFLHEARLERVPHGIVHEEDECPCERAHQQRCDRREHQRESAAQAAGRKAQGSRSPSSTPPPRMVCSSGRA